MVFFSSSPLSGREESLYIGGPFTKVVLFDLAMAAPTIRWEPLESSLEPRLLWVVWNLVSLTLIL